MGLSKLKEMLAREKGVDHSKEHQKKLRKEGEKKNRKKQQEEEEEEEEEDEDEITIPSIDVLSSTKTNDKATKDAKTNGKKSKTNGLTNGKRLQTEVDSTEAEEEDEDEDEEWESDDDEEDMEDEEMPTLLDTSRLNDSESSSSEEEDEDEEEEEDDDELMQDDEEDIPLSEISESDQEPDTDLIPRQRLTIDNHSALRNAHASVALPLKSLPFSSHQSLTTAEPVTIPDIHDDLKRELSFYAQALDAAKKARKLLHGEGVPFSRPTDYFAEMVKSEEHMGKIKDKMREEAAGKKASQEAKRQRDLKKFGKQVQVAKLQERHKEKRDTLDKIKMLKRKRAGADVDNANEDDPFDIAVEKATTDDRKRQKRDGSGGANVKRQKKDAKFGFGGKKRFSKSGDAESSGDLSRFSAKAMKSRSFGRSAGGGGRGGGGARGGRGGASGGRGGRGGAARLGKSKRQSKR